jgi:GTP-binding protein
LIEGAHEGHGLGHGFLSHLERTRVLVHVIDVSSETGRSPLDDFEVICKELASYRVSPVESAGVPLADKPQIVAANKVDALDEPDRLSQLKARLEGQSVPLFAVSAATGEGLDALQEAMWRAVTDTAPQTSRTTENPSE